MSHIESGSGVQYCDSPLRGHAAHRVGGQACNIAIRPLESALQMEFGVESIASLELCYYGYACDLELVHIHERINGLFQGDCPADEPFGRQFSGFNHRE